MAFGGAIFLIALGAIVRYALTLDISGIDLDVVGLVLMIAGIAGLLLSLAVMLFQNSGGQTPPEGGQGNYGQRPPDQRQGPPR